MTGFLRGTDIKQNLEESVMGKGIAMNWMIAIIVAAVYLLVGIAFHAWAYSWAIWIAYAMYRFIIR